MLFRYETEVPLARRMKCRVCPHRASLASHPCSSDFSHSLQSSDLKPFPNERLGGGYPYPVWIRRIGSTCTWNLHGLNLGLSQKLARLQWLCLHIQMCFFLWVFRWEINPRFLPNICLLFQKNLTFSSPPCRAALSNRLDSGCAINLGLNLTQVFLFAGYVTLSNIPWTCFFGCKMEKIMPVLQRHFMKMYIKGQAHTKLQGRESKTWTH